MSADLLSASVQKLLADARDQVRKKGASEVAESANNVFQHYPRPEAYLRLQQLLKKIEDQFLKNPQGNSRKGGLVAISAIANALPSKMEHDSNFVLLMSNSVITMIQSDADATVRLAAIESMTNLIAVFRRQVLKVAFTPLFRAMLTAVSEKEQKLQSSGHELSNQVKEVANEVETFDMTAFVAFLQDGFTSPVAEAINFLLIWIENVDCVPGRRLVLHLASFLGKLFGLIANQFQTIAINTERTLSGFLQQVRNQAADLNLQELIMVILPFCEHEKARTKEIALIWVKSILDIGGGKLLEMTHCILQRVLRRISDSERRVARLAEETNMTLATLLDVAISRKTATKEEPPSKDVTTSSSTTSEQVDYIGDSKINYANVLQVLVDVMDQPTETRHALLHWVSQLHQLRPDIVREHFGLVFPALLSMLRGAKDSELSEVVGVLNKMAGEDKFEHFISALINEVEGDSKILLPKLSKIYKQLQGIHEGSCPNLFLQTSRLLPSQRDKRFVAKFVLILDAMLLTSQEYFPLRELLKRGIDDKAARSTFLGLYPCWCFSAVSPIALCLLTKVYDQAYRLVIELSRLELSPHTLAQLDRLVQLLESPVFAYVRMDLLSPKRNASLVKTLFGIQMILPQASPQFRQLHQRLKSVTAVSHIGCEDELPAKKNNPQAEIRWAELVEIYKATQTTLRNMDTEILVSKSTE